MPDFISRTEALAKQYHTADDDGKPLRVVDASDIEAIPAADVAPVVHGKWIEHINDYENYCECDTCRFIPDSPLDETNYCPNCGAKMDLT